MSKPRIYIAGPMRGLEFLGFPLFDAAAKELDRRGWRVINPADLDRVEGFDAMDLTPGDTHNWTTTPANWPSYEAMMVRDLEAVEGCDAIYMLEGWRESEGANRELGCAVDQGLTVYDAREGYPDVSPSPLLQQAYDDMAGAQAVMRAVTYNQPVIKVLPEDAAARKTFPIYSGLMAYFPDALALVAHHSYVGNEQHHPGTPLHWDKSKSADELDAQGRHILEGKWVDVAWRSLAHLQRMVDAGWRPEELKEQG